MSGFLSLPTLGSLPHTYPSPIELSDPVQWGLWISFLERRLSHSLPLQFHIKKGFSLTSSPQYSTHLYVLFHCRGNSFSFVALCSISLRGVWSPRPKTFSWQSKLSLRKKKKRKKKSLSINPDLRFPFQHRGCTLCSLPSAQPHPHSPVYGSPPRGQVARSRCSSRRCSTAPAPSPVTYFLQYFHRLAATFC